MLTVRCPACLAAYQIDADKLGAGRKLKCAKCGTIWLATAENEAPQASVAAGPEAAPQVPAAAPVPSPPAEGLTEEKAPVFAPGDEEFISAPDLDSVVSARPAGWSVWWHRHQWMLGAVVLATAGLAMGLAVLMQQLGAPDEGEKKAQEHPAPAQAEVKKVIKPIEPPAGIVLRRVHSEVSATETGVLLTVRGLVTNTTSETVSVPPLLLQLLGKDGTVQDMWPVSSVAGDLPAQAENAWSVSLTEPTLDAVRGWRVVFTAPEAAAEVSASVPGAARSPQAPAE
jgi:predicted Zn finger-like uncharacterized protein